MIFIIKKSKLVLDCFTTKNHAIKYNPIVKANEHYPNWWLNTKKEYQDNFFKLATIKKCNGIIDYYRYGVILPLWSDLSIEIKNGHYNYQFADGHSSCADHDIKQWQTFADPNRYIHLKINSAWWFSTKKDIKFYWSKPFWNYDLENFFHIPSAILDFKYNNATHINMFIDITKNIILDFKFGTPLAHIVPLTEKELIIKNHLIDEKEAKKFINNISFINNYNAKKNILNKKKCPFNF